jgi:hypothetical protein
MEHSCPACGSTRTSQLRSWYYASYNVIRYQCTCGERFNEYYKKGVRKFILSNSQVGTTQAPKAIVAVVDKNLILLKEKFVAKGASLLMRDDKDFKVTSVGTTIATLRVFENTVCARELLPFLEEEDPDNYIIFIRSRYSNAAEFVYQNKKRLLYVIRSRMKVSRQA